MAYPSGPEGDRGEGRAAGHRRGDRPGVAATVGGEDAGDRLTLAEVLDVAEALWVDQIRERTLVERQVYAARMAQNLTGEFDVDNLPDVDKALELFAELMNADDSLDDLSPEDQQRVAVGLPKRRT